MAEFAKIVTFNQRDSSLGVDLNAMSLRSLEIQV